MGLTQAVLGRSVQHLAGRQREVEPSASIRCVHVLAARSAGSAEAPRQVRGGDLEVFVDGKGVADHEDKLIGLMLFDPGIPLTAVLLFWGVVWTMYGIRDPRWGHWLGSALALMGTMVSVSVASTAAFLSMGYGRVARAESRALKAAELALMDQSYGPLWITGLLCVLFAALVWLALLSPPVSFVNRAAGGEEDKQTKKNRRSNFF